MNSRKLVRWGTGSICLLAMVFTIFVIYSVSNIAEQANQMYEHPYQVKGEAQTMLTRLSEMKRHLPSLLMADYEHPEAVKQILANRDRQQDASLSVIQKRYLGNKRDVAELRSALARVRAARERAVDTLVSQKALDMPVVINYTSEHVDPYSDAVAESLEKIINYADKRVKMIRLTAESVRNTTSAGAVGLCVLIIATVIFTGISSQRKNQEIAYREKLFDLLSHNIDDVFFVYDFVNSRLEYISENCQRILNIPSREFYRDINVLRNNFTQDSCERFDALHSKAPFSEAVECDLQCRGQGRMQDLKLRIYPIFSSGKLMRYISVISDQTSIVAHQAAINDALLSAQKANEAKREFLSRMSHEIRTPMNAIIGMTTIAMKYLDDRERVTDCMGKIAYSSKHLLSLINDVLDMSKIEDGKLALNNHTFSFRRFIDSITAIIYPQAESQGQRFEVIISGLASEMLIGDELRLNQTLLNLLSNAIKFTPRHGEIRLEISQISAKGEKVNLRFVVRDTGIGMNKEFLPRLYTPFEQANDISRKYGGTGLGLSITNNLVSMMGGTISVESEEGKGTAFTVELPFELPEENRIQHSAELSKLNVLVVDDDRDTGEHALLLLDQIGVHGHWVGNGLEAVNEVVRAHSVGNDYDVCFIDWRMPDIDGVETTRRIRREVGPDTLIIIISSYDWAAIEQDARQAGANAFITKPFFASSLYNTLISLSYPDAMLAGDSLKKTEQYNFTGKKVLLAEDNSLNQEIATEILKTVGLTVDCALDGQEALDMYQNSMPGEYSLILMDVQMPRLDGYEATRAIRKSTHPEAETVPILAMTANAFNSDVVAAKEAGMNGHLAKPIDVDILLRMIASYLTI